LENQYNLVLIVTAQAFGAPDTATSLSSPSLSLVEFLSSVGIEPCIMGFKYMFNPFPLPIWLVAQVVVRMDMNMYLNPWVHDLIPTEGKNSIGEGVEKVVRWQCWDHLRW
jgi:hypothetical protein